MRTGKLTMSNDTIKTQKRKIKLEDIYHGLIRRL